MTAGKSGSTPQSDLWIKKLEPHDRKLELFGKTKTAIRPAMVHRSDIRRDQIGGFLKFQLFQLFRPLLNPYMYYMIKKHMHLNIRGKSWNSWNTFFSSPFRGFCPHPPPFREKKIPTFCNRFQLFPPALVAGEMAGGPVHHHPLLAGNTREVDP
ncbi:MAG: hypothetical protein AB7D01_06230 [Methanoculleus sp.]